MRWQALALAALLGAGCSHDLESVPLPCSDTDSCPTGSTCVSGVCRQVEAGTPDASKDLPPLEAGKPDVGLDKTQQDLPVKVEVGSPDGEMDKALPDKSITDKAVTDKTIADKAMADINIPDINIPDVNIPDVNIPDVNIPDKTPSTPDASLCGNSSLDKGEPCDGSLFLVSASCAGHLVKGVVFTGGVLACTSSCQVDTSGCTWVVLGASAGDEEAHGLAVDGAYNPVFTGYTSGKTGTIGDKPFNLTNTGSHLLLVKLKPGGTTEKITTVFGDGGHVSPRGLDLDASGNAFISGTFGKQLIFNGTALSATQGNAIFVAKALGTGVFDWGLLGPSGLSNTAHEIIVGPNNSTYIAGTFMGTAKFGTLVTKKKKTCYVAAINQYGSFAAAGHNTSDVSHCQVHGGLALVSQYVYIGGTSEGNVQYGAKDVSGSNNAHVARFYFSAKLGSAQNIIYTGVTRALATDSKRNVYVAGSYSSNAKMPKNSTKTLTPSKTGMNDLFVIKVDHMHYHQWAAKAGGSTGHEYVRDMAIDSKNNLYLTGEFTSTTASFGSSLSVSRNGPREVFVAKLSSGGTWEWVVQTSGLGAKYAGRIALDGNGHIYVSGWFTGQAAFGGSKKVTATQKDLFVWKIKDPSP